MTVRKELIGLGTTIRRSWVRIQLKAPARVLIIESALTLRGIAARHCLLSFLPSHCVSVSDCLKQSIAAIARGRPERYRCQRGEQPASAHCTPVLS
jgi:hypothetical protein